LTISLHNTDKKPNY